MATHHLDQVMGKTKRILVLSEGEIAEREEHKKQSEHEKHEKEEEPEKHRRVSKREEKKQQPEEST